MGPNFCTLSGLSRGLRGIQLGAKKGSFSNMRVYAFKSILILLVSLSLTIPALAAPKNAILYIGDGMGIAQVTAGRIYKGNARDGALTLDTFEHIAIIRTYATNQLVADSAAAGTALAAGVKTSNGRVGTAPDGTHVPSALELAKKAGKSVGIVTTTTLTHATPACFFGHADSRVDESALATQLIEYGQVDVVLGGGRQFFIPQSATDPESGGESRRRDDRDLIAEAKAKGYKVIMRQSEFDEVRNAGADQKVLGLFNPGMMNYDAERPGDTWGEPSLAEMASLAISILSKNPNGYFLMVEGGRIDHACHDNRAYLAVTDMVAFDEAIRAGVEATKAANDTLIVVTADHETGGLAINGYGPIEIGGQELITKPAIGSVTDIISFSSGPGADRTKMEGVARDATDYRQPSLYPAGSAAHTGVDVMAWAMGPGAEAVKGTMDNDALGRLVIESLGLK